ncbi:ACP S-malonyltransferase [Clostridium paraputrificum]|uniref:ACP S-malonyltransferase n=1 Tax=Clostridium paraputrificum TaxID=29363 RepID=UPI003D358C9E
MKVVMFPGQGTQYPKMYNQFKYARLYKDTFYKASEYLDSDLSYICNNYSEDELKQTEIAQLIVFVHNMGIYNILKSSGFNEDYVIGHSLGQINAFVASGTVSFKDGLNIVKKRSELMSNINVNGAMILILDLEEKIITNEIKDLGVSVHLAIKNSDSSFVFAGELKDIIKLKNILLKKYEGRIIDVAVNKPFHTPIMNPIKNEFKEYINSLKFYEPQIPVILNSTGKFAYNAEDIKDELVNQITSPVLWKNSIDLLSDRLGYNIDFYEVGARKGLSKILSNINPKFKTITTNSIEEIYSLVCF